jgi:hypothetical protein
VVGHNLLDEVVLLIQRYMADIMMKVIVSTDVTSLATVVASVLHGYGYTHGFRMDTAMGTGTGARILTHQIPVPMAVPMTKKLDFLEFKLLSEFKLTPPPYLTKQGKFLCFE